MEKRHAEANSIVLDTSSLERYCFGGGRSGLPRLRRLARPRAYVLLASVLLGWLLLQVGTALAGDAPTDVLVKICDQAAASPFDKTRPADVLGVSVETLNTSVAIPACKAAVDSAPRDSRMIYQLGRAYGAAKNFPDALRLYKQAAEMGNALAANNLAAMYGKGQGVEADPAKELYYLDQAAQARLGIAEYNLGVKYAKGSDILPKDENLARQWFYLSAVEKYPLGMYRYGLMIKRTGTKPEELAHARYWLQKAAEKAVPAAMAEFGDMLFNGIGGDRDLETSRQWYKKSAEAGNVKAQRFFGYMLWQGTGGHVDPFEARHWTEKAALAGDYAAMNNYGLFLQKGIGGSQDEFEARKWFEKSANGNNANAVNALGVMFETGAGGPRDRAEARRLYVKAIAMGERGNAKKNLDRLDAAAAP